jgi:hypothetical protein
MPRGPRTGEAFQVYLPEGMKDLLEILAKRNYRKMSSEFVMALTKHLEANGLPYTPPAANGTATPAKKGTRKK